jgi:LytS/YehU family sensor histidine kinase
VAIDKDHTHIHWSEIAFLANYVVTATIINYILLPRFFYPKKIKTFLVLLLLLLCATVVVEEFVLEQIFYPHTRGHYFHLLTTIAEVMPVILLLVAGKFAWDATVNQRKVESMNRMMIESQLEQLKQQINPHFLFNNLNNLYAYAIENSPKTPEIILELSALLRYMLYDCKEQSVGLQKEIDHIRSFIKISELQLEGKGDVVFNSNVQEDRSIAPLILIVFIENAFKHSQASQSEDIRISIHIELKGDVLTMHCENTYGMQSNQPNTEGGIGLQNAIARLNLLYPEAHKLDIQDDNGIYRVELSINLKELKV